MIPIKQKYIHIPDQQHGDCWRACIASVLECDIELFPYHNGDITWPEEYNEMMEILDSTGYEYSSIPIDCVLSGVLESQDTHGYCIAIGRSQRGVNHAVVWKNGIAHDPHPDNTGIIDILRFEVFHKKNN